MGWAFNREVVISLKYSKWNSYLYLTSCCCCYETSVKFCCLLVFAQLGM